MRFWTLLGRLSLFAFAVGGLLPTVRAGEAPPTTAGIQFTGSPGRVTLDPGFSLAGRSFTVEAWIWLNAAGGDRPVLAQIGSENLLHLVVRNNRLYFGFWNDDLAGATDVPIGEWVHVAYTYDEATREQRVFLNGVLDGNRTGNASFAENNLPLHIGAFFDFSLNPFDGRILELRVWDHARSEGQIADGRFATPAVDAPGLDALFSFEGIVGNAVPEATGSLTGNELHGAVTAVAPVLPPALLAPDAPVAFAVPAGSLDFAVSGYVLDPAASASYPDLGGGQLSDGLIPYRVWGTPWLDFSGARTEPLLAWENASPEITFNFTERVRLDAITLYAANSGGVAGVALPQSVQVRSPGGFSASFPLVPGDDVGAMQAIVLDALGIFTEAVTITLESAGDWIALGEVTFDGEVLADPALQAQDGWLTLPAKRFLGLAPDAVDASAIDLDVVLEEAGARFEFPRAVDDFGVQAVVKWSTNLVDWTPLPYAPAAELGRAVAVLTPPPAEGRAFFRLVFPDGPPIAAAPGSVSAMESDGLLAFHPLAAPGAIETPLDPASLQLLAINDQPLDAFTGPIATPSGGTLEILPDGTITYAANPGLAEGQVAEETLTYTVVDRFGRSVRNTFTLSVVGENDPPSVGSFAGTHAAGVEIEAGVAYRYFSGSFATEAQFNTAVPVRTGRIPTVALDPADFDGSGGALEITGELFVPASGPYTFYLTGTHGSVLDVGGTRVVDYDAGSHVAERSGTIELAAGLHRIRVRYFDAAFSEGSANLTLEYSGPGFARAMIPASAFPKLVEDAGVAYRYFSGSFATEAAFDTATPVRSGRIPTVALDPADFDGSGGALEITGELFVPASGPYTFYLTGNHGSVLDVGGTRVVDYDAANHTPARSGTVELSAGSHPIRVRYFDAVFSEGNAALTLEYSGPGFIREPIPANAFPRLADLPIALASDPDDGDVLRISHLNGVPVPEGEAAVLPSGATLLLDGSGQITYRPAPGRTILHESVDTEAFTFTVSDAGGLSATGTAEIELRRLNIAPVLNPDVRQFTTGISIVGRITLSLADLAAEAEGIPLRITHVNGQPLGAAENTLPSTARVSLNGAAELYYDGLGSFVLMLDQPTAEDSFTVTLTDPAGASIDLPVALHWTLDEGQFRYSDSRFDSSLGPRTARIDGHFRFPVETLVSITDRQTGIRYGQRSHTFEPFQTFTFDFDLPPGIDLAEGEHFFERFALEIDRPDGVQIFYGFQSGDYRIEALYSTANRSFFRVVAPTSPHWPPIIEYTPPSGGGGQSFEFFEGDAIIETAYGSIMQVFRAGRLARGRSANILDLEPNFAANITIQGVCRTFGASGISRFSIQNLNDEPVPFTVGTGNTVFTVGAGQTQTIEIPYEPKVPIFILEALLGLFDSNEETCVAALDFTATSLCANTFISFTQVQNNDPVNAFTVRVESVSFPGIRSDPVTIGNQGNALIQMMSEGQNLSGTEGRVIVILPGGIEVEAATFIFSDQGC